jgi:hypothetical protein
MSEEKPFLEVEGLEEHSLFHHMMQQQYLIILVSKPDHAYRSRVPKKPPSDWQTQSC